MLTAQATVSMSWVSTVISSAERCGVGRSALLAHADIAEKDLAQERLPIDHITRLWRSAAKLSADPGFGLKTGSLVGPASFNVVSFILQSSSTLRDAMAQVQKFHRLISDGGRFQIIAGDEQSWIVYHPQQGTLAFSAHQIEAVFAALVSFSAWVTGKAFVLHKVQFGHERIGPLQHYLFVLHCTPDFEQAFSGLQVENALLDQKLPQADVQLANLHREYASARLAALSHAPDFAEEIRLWLLEHLVKGVPDRETAARRFGLSDRVFARRLQSLGLNYTELVDTVRKDAACGAVTKTALPFGEIAQSLGFSESSTFNRAFKRWTGQAPGECRGQGVHRS
jgi:AraC-like DNA-binding protein